ncbi:hypothetical protein FACS1894105_12880 [Clostridia bacterium]|nr:hypothetical protein FACS1894105_12880 [Clostridia bacterium]
MIGYAKGTITIENCFAKGDVSSINFGFPYAGGLVGYAEGIIAIENCFSTGDVTSTAFDSRAGGLVGYANGTITINNCYARGDVTSLEYLNEYDNDFIIISIAGGLVGDVSEAETTITNSYATGDITSTSLGDSYAGGLVGNASVTITIENDYRLSTQTIVGKTKNGIGSPLTSANMKKQISFVGWDFDTVWAINSTRNNGYPDLQVFGAANSNDNGGGGGTGGGGTDGGGGGDGTGGGDGGDGTGGGGDNTDDTTNSGIDYVGITEIIITGSAEGFSINLTKETLTAANYTAYSIDGGAKWKSGTLTDAAFVKLLSKDLTLWLTDDLDSKTKKPISDATITKFDKITKRPPAPKLFVNYKIGASSTGSAIGDWVLTAKNGTTAVKNGIEIAVASSTGKTADEKGFGIFYAGQTNGIPIKPLEGTKVTKSVYLVRTAPKKEGSVYTAASKPAKISATSEQKATKYKADYKKEIIKLKKGDMIFAGTADSFGNATPTSVSSATSSIADGQWLYITAAKGSSVSLSEYLSENAETIIVWKAGSEKKAPTKKQVYILAPRAVIKGETLSASNGKVAIPATYEVFSSEKWGKLPKITASKSFDIRIKATAKGTGVDDSSKFAASVSGTIAVTYGSYDTNKNGITEAVITPPTTPPIENPAENDVDE